MKKSLSAILICIFLIICVGVYAEWENFGGSFSNIKNAQFNNSYGNIVNSTNITISKGYSSIGTTNAFQPLSSNLGTSSKYIILVNYDTLSIFNSTLGLVTSLNTTNPVMGQISITDFDGDNFIDDIVGYYYVNNTFLKFKVFSYNQSNNSLYLSNTFNITNSLNISTMGVRCKVNKCFSVVNEKISGSSYTVNLYIHNSSGQFNISMPITMIAPARSLLSESDINLDGISDYVTFSHHDSYVFSENKTNFGYNTWYADTDYIPSLEDVRFYKSKNSPFPKMVFINDFPYSAFSSVACGLAGYSCIKLQYGGLALNGTGTLYAVINPASTSGDIKHYLGSAIADYDGDGTEDIFIATSTSVSNVNSVYGILNGDSASWLFYGMNIGGTVGLTQDYPYTQIAAGKLDETNLYSMFIANGNTLAVVSTVKNVTVTYNTSFSGSPIGCLIDDINQDNLNDLVCSSPTLTGIIKSNSYASPIINNITLQPSSNFFVNQTISISVNAVTYQNLSLWYLYKCFNNDSYSADTILSTSNCTYTTNNSYNISVLVYVVDRKYNATIFQQISVSSISTNVIPPSSPGGGSIDYSTWGGTGEPYNPVLDPNNPLSPVYDPNDRQGESSGSPITVFDPSNRNMSWMVQTNQGGSIYTMVLSSILPKRAKYLVYTNLGTEIINLKISCEGKICLYINFTYTNLTLQVGKTKLEVVKFDVDYTNVKFGSYSGKLVSTDQNGNTGVVSITASKGGAGILISLFEKLFGSLTIGTWTIWYAALYIPLFLFVYLIMSFLLGKLDSGIPLALLLAAVSVIILLLII